MAATSLGLEREIDDLVLEQIRTFKQPERMSDPEILEYHLRHCQIRALYRELDRVAHVDNPPREGWWS